MIGSCKREETTYAMTGESPDLQSLQALLWNEPTMPQWRADAADLLRSHREMVRIERRTPDHHVAEAVDSPYTGSIFMRIKREDLDLDTEVACSTAVRQATPVYSRSYPEAKNVEK